MANANAHNEYKSEKNVPCLVTEFRVQAQGPSISAPCRGSLDADRPFFFFYKLPGYTSVTMCCFDTPFRQRLSTKSMFQNNCVI